MKIERDELLYIPRDGMYGGFMCPKCLTTFGEISNYCPYCGQHIKVIAAKDFKDLKKGLGKIGADDVDKVAVKYMGSVSGIYKSRLDKLTGNENYIAGQMELSDFLQ